MWHRWWFLSRRKKNSIQFGIIRNLNGMTWISERRRNMGHFPFTIKSTGWAKKKPSATWASTFHRKVFFARFKSKPMKVVCARQHNWRFLCCLFFVAVRSGKENKVNVKRCITNQQILKTVYDASHICLIGSALCHGSWTRLGLSACCGTYDKTRRGSLGRGEDVTKAPNMIDICVHVYNYVSPSCSLLFAMLSACRWSPLIFEMLQLLLHHHKH